MVRMSRGRGIPYPQRHLGRWLEKAVERKIANSSELNSASAISRWLGHPEVTRMNKWIKGRLLPTREDYPDLARLGLPEERIHELVVLDRMNALAYDEELDDEALMRTAANLAHLAGMTKEELIELLLETDLEELERVLESS